MVVYLLSDLGGKKPLDSGTVLERDSNGFPLKVLGYNKRKRKKTNDVVWTSYVKKMQSGSIFGDSKKREKRYVPRNFRTATIKQRRGQNFQKRPIHIAYKNVLLELYNKVDKCY